MPTDNSKDLQKAIAKERLISHLIEHGVARPFAEAHAASATYDVTNDGALIQCGAGRAVSHDSASIAALAAEIAKTTPADQRSSLSTETGGGYDPVAAGRAAAAATKRTKEDHELATRSSY